MKITYLSHFSQPKSAKIFHHSWSRFHIHFLASISRIEFRSKRSRAWNFWSSYNLSIHWANFFQAFSISILVEWVNFWAVLCLFSTLAAVIKLRRMAVVCKVSRPNEKLWNNNIEYNLSDTRIKMATVKNVATTATRLMFNRIRSVHYHNPILQVQRRTFMYRTYDYVKKNDMVKVMPGGSAESRRYVLKKDGLGYSFHYVQIAENSSMYIHYKHHQESCLCVEGSLEIEVSVFNWY